MNTEEDRASAAGCGVLLFVAFAAYCAGVVAWMWVRA